MQQSTERDTASQKTQRQLYFIYYNPVLNDQFFDLFFKDQTFRVCLNSMKQTVYEV